MQQISNVGSFALAPQHTKFGGILSIVEESYMIFKHTVEICGGTVLLRRFLGHDFAFVVRHRLLIRRWLSAQEEKSTHVDGRLSLLQPIAENRKTCTETALSC